VEDIVGAAGRAIGNATGRAVKVGVEKEVSRLVHRIAEDDMLGRAAAAAAGGASGATGMVDTLAKGIQKKIGGAKASFTAAHREVAERMRKSVVSSYDQTVGGGGPANYRIGQGGTTKGGFKMRYSGGSLRTALKAPELAVGTSTGIMFVDAGRLTKEAAHWARLNFGARGETVGERSRGAYNLNFDRVSILKVGFNEGSRAAFYLPPGRWRSPGNGRWYGSLTERKGMDMFFPGKATRAGDPVDVYYKEKGRIEYAGYSRKRRTGLNRTKTAGIRSREFLDAGLRTMVKETPLHWKRIVDSWLADPKKAARLPGLTAASGIKAPHIKTSFSIE
jgi:hypothetical protein